jgi:hypothetical protein
LDPRHPRGDYQQCWLITRRFHTAGDDSLWVFVQASHHILQPVGLDEAIIVGYSHKARPHAFETAIDGSGPPTLRRGDMLGFKPKRTQPCKPSSDDWA